MITRQESHNLEFTFYPTIYHQRREAFNMIYPIHAHSKFPGRIKRWSKKFLRKKQILSNQSWEVFANKYDRIYVMNWFMQRDIFLIHYSSKALCMIRNVPKYLIISCSHVRTYYLTTLNKPRVQKVSIVFSYILQ